MAGKKIIYKDVMDLEREMLEAPEPPREEQAVALDILRARILRATDSKNLTQTEIGAI
jgi:hypothetical protein